MVGKWGEESSTHRIRLSPGTGLMQQNDTGVGSLVCVRLACNIDINTRPMCAL